MILSGLSIVSGWMFLLWMIQYRRGNAALVDLGWTVSVPLLHFYFAWGAGGDLRRNLLLASLTGLWGARLGGHLYWTRLRPGMPEEGRYQKLREEWKENFQRNLFFFYQAQALAAWVLVAVFVPVYRDPNGGFGLPEKLGCMLFLLGWLGVSLADAQLKKFKDDPNSHGKVCQLGLWNYTRHPNYFFESLLWCGWACYGLASPGGLWAWVAPASILHLVLNVTGIPPTEAQAVRSKGQAYKDYQATTSAFVPWFKKAL